MLFFDATGQRNKHVRDLKKTLYERIKFATAKKNLPSIVCRFCCRHHACFVR